MKISRISQLKKRELQYGDKIEIGWYIFEVHYSYCLSDRWNIDKICLLIDVKKEPFFEKIYWYESNWYFPEYNNLDDCRRVWIEIFTLYNNKFPMNTESTQVQLDAEIYWENEFACEDDTNTTEDGQTILVSDTIETYEGNVYHCDHIPSDCVFCDDIEQYSSEYTLVYDRRWQTYHHCMDDLIFYCGEYFTEDWAERHDIRYCDSCERYMRDGDDECDCGSDDRLDSYQDGQGCDEWKCSRHTKYRVWIEFEKSEILWGHNELRDLWFRCEEDGSVEAEYITPVLDLTSAFTWLTNNAKRVIEWGINSSCGGHIHVSIEGQSPSETYANLYGWRPLLWGLYPHRVEHNYSDKNRDKEDHYADVGLRDNTVEIRIFPWCGNVRTLEFRLALLQFILEHPRRELWDARRTIVYSKKLHSIFDIAYGDNSERLERALERINDFYKQETGFITDSIRRLAKRITNKKELAQKQTSIITNNSEICV